MRKLRWFCFCLCLSLLLSGCLRWASVPTVDLSQFTPQPATLRQPTMTVQGTSAPDQTPSVFPSLTATLPLSEAAADVLEIFPLRVGSAWVYDYLGFEEDVEASWQIRETVIATEILDGYYVAEIERIAALTSDAPPDSFSFGPQTGTYWYLIDGVNVYRFASFPNGNLSRAWLAFIIPFPESDEAWYPDPAKRAAVAPGALGRRYASAPFQQVLPTRNTHLCYNLVTRDREMLKEETFCEGVGIVFGENRFTEADKGFRFELIAFTLQ